MQIGPREHLSGVRIVAKAGSAHGGETKALRAVQFHTLSVTRYVPAPDTATDAKQNALRRSEAHGEGKRGSTASCAG